MDGKYVIFVRNKTTTTNSVVDLRSAQVYWDAIFWVSQKVYLNFHIFVGKIVGGVGGEGIYRN